MLPAIILQLTSSRAVTGLPRPLILDDLVGDDEQFSHARHDGDLLGFAVGDQALVEGPQRRVVPDRHQRPRVERRPDAPPATSRDRLADRFSALAVVGRDADQGGNFLLVEPAQLGQAD